MIEQRIQVLVAGTDSEALRPLHERLVRAGFEVVHLPSGSDVLRLTETHAPALILLATHLDDMDGIDLLRRLRARPDDGTLRVVGIGPFGVQEEALQWLAAGSLDVLDVTAGPEAFEEKLRQWVGVPVPPDRRGGEEPRRFRLGEILLSHRLITPEQLDAAVAAQAGTTKRLGQVLVEQGAVTEDDVCWALSTQLGYPYVFLNPGIIDREAAALIPEELMREHLVLPILRFGDEMTLAMADPTDHRTVAEVQRRTGLQVKRSLALPSNIRAMFDHLFSGPGSGAGTSGTPEVQHLHFHLLQAVLQGASEIHLEPLDETRARVRYRLQGQLVDRIQHSADLHGALLQHLRDLVRAGEGPTAQGSATTRVGDIDVFVVASFVPTLNGPAATVAFYPLAMGIPDLAPLGVGREEIEQITEMIASPQGVVLVACPDPLLRSMLLHALLPLEGNGKTWALQRLPVFRHPAITQTPLVGSESVAALLRSPFAEAVDRIVIDDASRSESLRAIFEAGAARMVIVGDAAASGSALLALAVESAGTSVVAAVLRGLVVARPIRILCPACKREAVGASEVAFEPRGCEACGFTGFRGRRVLVGVWVAGRRRWELLPQRDPGFLTRLDAEIEAQLLRQARELLADGLTSAGEVGLLS